MKKLRKVNPAKRKQERKDVNEKMAERTAMFLDHPTECCVCGATFERTLETVRQWYVVVREKRVRLTCPNCWGTISEALENPNVKNS
tara:strand:- start:218 stop:478 length:261 start_codon:yes stop_codon:yes gene_type:complete